MRQALNREEFTQAMAAQALLCQYTLHGEGDPQEEGVRKHFGIDCSPTLLLLDPQGIEFARFGYLAFDPSKCARCLLKVISDFKEICAALDKKNKKRSTENWLELYRKADQLSCKTFKKMVLDRGIAEDLGTTLLWEKYLLLLKEKGLKSKEVKSCRKQLIQKDPQNQQGIHFKIALSDFHTLIESKKKPEKVLRPLVEYLMRFEKKDRQNAWRAQIEIARYLTGLKRYQNALEFARKAYLYAPESIKESINEEIVSIQSKL